MRSGYAWRIALLKRRSLSFRTEKEGFEPSRRFSRPTPFPGEPLRPLGYFSKKIPTNVVYVINTSQRSFLSGEDGIRTHVPVRTNGFQDRLVMTASIPLHQVRPASTGGLSASHLSREQMISYQNVPQVSTPFCDYFCKYSGHFYDRFSFCQDCSDSSSFSCPIAVKYYIGTPRPPCFRCRGINGDHYG